MLYTRVSIGQSLILCLGSWMFLSAAAPNSEPTISSPAANRELQSYNARIRKNPNDADAFVDRAKFLFEHMELKAARADLQRSLAIKPTAWAYLILGKVDFDPKNTKLALADLAKARQLGDKDYQLLVNLAPVLNQLRRQDLAINAYQQALKIHPGDLVIMGFLVGNLQQAGRYDETIKLATEVINKTPTVTALLAPQQADATLHHFMKDTKQGCYRSRGVSLMELHRYPEALADLNLALQLNPTDRESLCPRAQVYKKMGKLGLASRDLNAIGKLKNEESDFLFQNAPFEERR